MNVCKKCGTPSLLVGDVCVFCEDTQEIKIPDFEIKKDKTQENFCTKCGRKKKWVTITARKGPEFICPKCG